MNRLGRQAASWFVVIGVVAAMAVAIAVRGGTSATGAPPSAQSADAVVAEASAPSIPTPMPTPRPTLEPTPEPTPAPTPTLQRPTAQPTPIAVAPAPTATPVPIHDDEPVLLTEERVDGTLGDTLTIAGYSVRAVRVAAPAPGECATISREGDHFYEITLTYAGPLRQINFDIGGGVALWCFEGEDFEADASPADHFPSGMTRSVLVRPGENSAASGRPLNVYLSVISDSHTYWYVFG